jgi:hypothetical protein
MSDDSLKEILASAMAASLRNLPTTPIEPPGCRDCGKAYEVPDAARYEPRFDYLRYCDACAAKRDTQRCLDRGFRSVPAAYAWAALDAPELEKRVTGRPAVKDAPESVLGAARVVFVGGAGMGKTSLAVALYRYALPKVRGSGLFVSAFRLAEARSKMRLGEESPLLAAATSVRLLLLDDVGNEPKTELSSLPSVVFERHEDERPAWVTTAFGPDELARRYGDGFARRVFERALVIRLGAK